jgi:hypothetical protein
MRSSAPAYPEPPINPNKELVRQLEDLLFRNRGEVAEFIFPETDENVSVRKTKDGGYQIWHSYIPKKQQWQEPSSLIPSAGQILGPMTHEGFVLDEKGNIIPELRETQNRSALSTWPPKVVETTNLGIEFLTKLFDRIEIKELTKKVIDAEQSVEDSYFRAEAIRDAVRARLKKALGLSNTEVAATSESANS